MFITTRAEFVWDKNLKQYTEVYTDGYEYNGVISKCHGDHSGTDIGEGNPYDPNETGQFYQFQGWNTTHNNYHSSTGAETGMGDSSGSGDGLTLYDFTTMSGDDIMRALGYAEDDVTKYSEFVPKPEEWREAYILEEYETTEDIYDFKEISHKNKMRGLEESYGATTSRLEGEAEGTLSQGEQNLFSLYEQGQQIAGGGLGMRKGMSERSRAGLVSQTKGAMDVLGGRQIEASNIYQTGMTDTMADLGELSKKRDLNLMNYNFNIQEARQTQSDDVYAFLSNLMLNYDIQPEEE